MFGRIAGRENDEEITKKTDNQIVFCIRIFDFNSVFGVS